MVESLRETAGDGDLPTGFRGLAAGFQPEVARFFRFHKSTLCGLARIDDMDMFTSCLADVRPDYLLVSGRDQPPGLRDGIEAAVRTAHLAVLVICDARADWADAGPVLVVDGVAPDTSRRDVALVLRALMRRSRPQAMVGRARWGDLELDEARLTFAIRDSRASLSLEAFSVLGLMMDDPGRVWDRTTIHRLVFGAGSANDLRSVDTRISRARRHVLSASGCDPIRTVRGVGYALVPAP